MCFLSYSKRLEVLKLYSLQRRGGRYGIIYVWKIIEGLVPNLSDPITCSFSDRMGRACVVCHSSAGRLATLEYNSCRWRSIRMFNRLPEVIRMPSSCSVVGFKSKLDSYLRNIVDLPYQPGFNNSLDGGNCLHGGHYVDDLAKQSNSSGVYPVSTNQGVMWCVAAAKETICASLCGCYRNSCTTYNEIHTCWNIQ